MMDTVKYNLCFKKKNFFFIYIKRVPAKGEKIEYKKNPACRQTL